jgi:hypothetical protein
MDPLLHWSAHVAIMLVWLVPLKQVEAQDRPTRLKV